VSGTATAGGGRSGRGRFALTVLGADGSYPGPGGACSGYLLRTDGFCIWMETGTGTMANLQLHIPLEQIDAVVISHAHPDHWADLDGLYVAMRYFIGRQDLPVYAPDGLRDLLHGETAAGTFDWRVIKDGMSADIGPFRWTWSQTEHPVETLAARVDVQGRSLGYSADTGSGWTLANLGPGMNLALVEASMTAEHEGSWYHLSARQAGLMAKEASAEKLVITHLAPTLDGEKAREEASLSFGRAAELARVGETWHI
jgi:ribonuclease BN (tRNA processing enzyme)